YGREFAKKHHNTLSRPVGMGGNNPLGSDTAGFPRKADVSRVSAFGAKLTWKPSAALWCVAGRWWMIRAGFSDTHGRPQGKSHEQIQARKKRTARKSKTC